MFNFTKQRLSAFPAKLKIYQPVSRIL